MMRTNPQVTLGFLSVQEDVAIGAVAGLLLLNTYGRPVELHCSVPVRVNRAQTLLYGESLRSQLFGHTIAPALFAAVQHPPALVVTDCLDMLAYRDLCDTPMVYVSGSARDSARDSMGDGGLCESIGGCSCLASPRFRDDLMRVRTLWTDWNPTIELQEPFQRLREALREMTVPGSGQAGQGSTVGQGISAGVGSQAA